MKELSKALRLTFVLILFFGVCYPLFIWAIGRITPHSADGLPIIKDRKLLGYENIGQSFSDDNYFWGRPSAVGYNAASTGGSNQGPTNPAHIALVKERIDSFLVHNPGVSASDIPADLVTASGGGLDPHITPESALIQVKRVAVARNIDEATVRALVESNIEEPVLGIFGTRHVNVLKLNLSLDEVK